MLTSDGVFEDTSGTGRDVRVLDLYAGSGALGLEAISRGARSAVLVESGRAALAAIRENTRALKLDDQVTILGARVDRALAQVKGPFDLVLIDPPYADVRGREFAKILADAARLLTSSGVLVLEHASTDEPSPPPGLALDRRRKHGDTSLSLFRHEAPGPQDAGAPPGTAG
jgi:16S rRNA (guanine966-N2)-methyltransferase